MRLQAHIDWVFQDRHQALRHALDDFEATFAQLEAAHGRVGEEQVTPVAKHRRWSKEPTEGASPRVRVFSTNRLREIWNQYLAEVLAHLEREEVLLPMLARGLTTGEVTAGGAVREVTALMAEHEVLYNSTHAVRRSFLGVDPLRRAFARVEDEYSAHAEAEDTGVFRDLLDFAESSVELDSTPVMERYREEENLANSLRKDLAARPPTDHDQGRSWFSWFKKTFTR